MRAAEDGAVATEAGCGMGLPAIMTTATARTVTTPPIPATRAVEILDFVRPGEACGALLPFDAEEKSDMVVPGKAVMT
jgi:hypothetical protein